MATANAATAAHRQGPDSLLSPGASARRNHTKNGTSTMRSMVRMLGRFQIPELLEPAAVASVLVTFLGYRLPGPRFRATGSVLPPREGPGVFGAVTVVARAVGAVGAVVVLNVLRAVVQ